eukprot:6752557-Heterocapsa_arctica.AAC.1
MDGTCCRSSGHQVEFTYKHLLLSEGREVDNTTNAADDEVQAGHASSWSPPTLTSPSTYHCTYWLLADWQETTSERNEGMKSLRAAMPIEGHTMGAE